ncbi:MAG: hypothetical protein Q8R53_03320 [Nanoarchaeota archaeon]|nr:hypothetical protein [Nanoarchaeota archaeon]
MGGVIVLGNGRREDFVDGPTSQIVYRATYHGEPIAVLRQEMGGCGLDCCRFVCLLHLPHWDDTIIQERSLITDNGDLIEIPEECGRFTSCYRIIENYDLPAEE